MDVTRDYMFEEYGLAYPTSPSNLAVSWFNSTKISLTWTVGTSRTVLVRNATAYPATPAKGTIVYNGTGTSATDSGLLPSHNYYYRAWDFETGYGFSSTNVSLSQYTRPNPPYNTHAFVIGTSGINITWLNGTGSKRTVIRKSATSQPLLPTDGTLLYNGTLKYKVDTPITQPYYYTLFSYNTTTNLYSSPGTNLSWYIVWINCYNGTGKAISNFSVFFTNPSGSQTYQHVHCNNPFLVNVSSIPQGNDITLLANATGYTTKVLTFNIIITGNYYINVYLTNSTKLYFIKTIDISNSPLPNVYVQIKKYINATAGYQLVYSGYSDAVGELQVYLTGGTLHLVTLSKDGYNTTTTQYWPDPIQFGIYYPKYFMLYKSAAVPDMFTYITYSINPIVTDQYQNFTVYYNISCPTGILNWFRMNVYLWNDTSLAWNLVWAYNQTNLSTGGNLSHYLNMIGLYGVQCSFQLQNYQSHTFGTYSNGKYMMLYNLFQYNATSAKQTDIDTKITKVAGKSPVFVGTAVVGYTSLFVTTLITFGLFTFSPKFSGLGLISVGMVLGWMKAILGIIGDATMNWGMIAIVVIFGILVLVYTNMRETGE